MIVALLIIASLTFLAICISLFLNHKANLRNNQSANLFKNEVLDKLQDLNNTTILKFNSAIVEIQNTVNESSKFIHEKLLEEVKESDLNTSNIVSLAKTSMLDSIESNLEEFNSEIQTTLKELQKIIEVFKTEVSQNIQKASAEINDKIQSFLQAQEQNNSALANEVKKKFNDIIQEIKNPLTLD